MNRRKPAKLRLNRETLRQLDGGGQPIKNIIVVFNTEKSECFCSGRGCREGGGVAVRIA